jgi:HK97 family phage portal protein
MGLLTSKLGIRALSIEDPSQPLQPYSVLVESLGLGQSDAGVLMNEKQAMSIATVFACVKVTSEDVASMPNEVYRVTAKGREPAPFHRLYPILHDAPNDYTAAMVFWQTLIAWRQLWGNGFALISRDRAARVTGLHIMPADKTRMARVDGKVWCVTTATKDGMPEAIDPSDVLHIMGVSFDGLNGLSPVQVCKNAFGLTKAAERFGAQLFGNGARTSGVLSHPGSLGPEALENLKKSIKERLSGNNALQPLVLEEGMTWTQISINPDDAQFLATRKFQRSEICSMYRVPLHKVQDIERATNNNIEHQSLEYHQSTLRPIAVGIEQEIKRKLFAGTQFFSEFNMDGLLRGDFVSRQTGFNIQRNAGVLDVDEWRGAEGKNPIGDEAGGSLRIVPVNMVSLTSLARQDAAGAAAADGESSLQDPIETEEGAGDETTAEGERNAVRRFHVLASYRRIFRDGVGRLAHRKVRDGRTIGAVMMPAVYAMAEGLYATRLDGKVELSGIQQAAIAAYCQSIDASAWRPEDAAAVSERELVRAYDHLNQLLFGDAN